MKIKYMILCITLLTYGTTILSSDHSQRGFTIEDAILKQNEIFIKYQEQLKELNDTIQAYQNDIDQLKHVVLVIKVMMEETKDELAKRDKALAAQSKHKDNTAETM